MPVPIEFLRGVLGILCVFFAHMLGRSAGAVRAGRQRSSRLYAWIIRTFLCGAALLFRHSLDTVALVVYLLAAIAAGAGFWNEQRPKPQEDLTDQIFPSE
jgi:hypothetical protein